MKCQFLYLTSLTFQSTPKVCKLEKNNYSTQIVNTYILSVGMIYTANIIEIASPITIGKLGSRIGNNPNKESNSKRIGNYNNSMLINALQYIQNFIKFYKQNAAFSISQLLCLKLRIHFWLA